MNSLKIFLMLLFLGIIAGACEKFTEPGKDNQYTTDRVLKDPAFAEGILTYAYMRMQSAYLFDEVATDDAVANDNGNIYRRIGTGEWSPQFFRTLTVGQSDWATAYTSIYNVNYFLTVVNDVVWSRLSTTRNADFIKLFTGEAHALRAYWYSWLLVRYGGLASNDALLGVPLVTSPINVNDQWSIPRSTYQETLNQIDADFKKAIDLLPANFADVSGQTEYNKVFGNIHRNRISGNIAKALKARIYLHAASPAYNNGSYDAVKSDSAASIAGRLLVIKGGIAGLPTDGVLFYDADNDITNADILWRNNYSNSNSLEAANYPPTLFGNGRVNPTRNLVDAFPTITGYPVDDAASGYDPANPYANRDPRLAKYILTNGATMRGTVINTANDSPTSDGLNNVPNYSTRTGYYMIKLLRTSINMNPAGPNTARHFYTHLRWTELYLSYAEAANEAWGPDGDPNGYGLTARAVTGAIRKRAGITQTGTNTDAYLDGITTKEQLRELIRNERRLELSFEGFRFWDIRRWNLNLTETAEGVSINAGVYSPIDVENRIYQPYAVYGPIPFTEVIKYTGMLQNKGW